MTGIIIGIDVDVLSDVNIDTFAFAMTVLGFTMSSEEFVCRAAFD